MKTYEQRHKTIADAAWEHWANVGLEMDDDELVQTSKSASDAATNAYVEGMSDKEWLAATLKRLGAL